MSHPFHAIFSLSLILSLTSAGATAAKLATSLNKEPTGKFNSYNYHAYTLNAQADLPLQIGMHSKSFDAYIMLVRPDGIIISNDDDKRIGQDYRNQGGGDAGIRIERPMSGQWLLVATSNIEGEDGSYEIDYFGTNSISLVKTSPEIQEKIRNAFADRGVEDENLKRNALLEQLTLTTFRSMLMQKLITVISRIEGNIEETQTKLTYSETRKTKIQTSAAEIKQLNIDSKQVIEDLLEKEGRYINDNIKELNDALLKATREKEAYTNARQQLIRLNDISARLKIAEEAFFQQSNTTTPITNETEVSNLKRQRDELSKDITDKLLNSRLVSELNHGGFKIAIDFHPHRISRVFYYLDVFSLRNYSTTADGKSQTTGAGRPVSGDESLKPDLKHWLPALLPWPPPESSSRFIIPTAFLKRQGHVTTMGEIDDLIRSVLSRAGYSNINYWGVPNGFALVTPLEQTNENGTPLSGRMRWQTSIAEMKEFNLSAYLSALLVSQPGYFRIIVFIVTSMPFAPSDTKSQIETLQKWAQKGLNYLPEEIRSTIYTEHYKTTVLVYEFMKKQDAEIPFTKIPGRIQASDHLSATKISFDRRFDAAPR